MCFSVYTFEDLHCLSPLLVSVPPHNSTPVCTVVTSIHKDMKHTYNNTQQINHYEYCHAHTSPPPGLNQLASMDGF